MSVASPVIDHIDTDLKRIFLRTGVTEYHPVTDIYEEVRYLRRTIEPLRKYKIMVTAEGNKPKGGGKFTARYAIFNNGYKIVPQDADHALYVSGEQITDDGQSGPACIDTSILSAGTNVTIHYEPPASELVRADAELAIIMRSAYQGTVALDVANGIAGTAIGVGTHSVPSNNIVDTMSIANSYGIESITIHGTLVLGTGHNVAGMVLKGENAIATQLIINPIADVTGCQFEDLFISESTFDGYTYVKHCAVRNVNGFNGFMESAMLSSTIALASGSTTYFVDCKSGCVGLGTNDLPVIDVTGANLHVAFRNWAGPMKIVNSTSALNTLCIDVASGATVILDNTCTAGTIYIRGIADIQNNSGMTIILTDALTIDGIQHIADTVRSKVVGDIYASALI